MVQDDDPTTRLVHQVLLKGNPQSLNPEWITDQDPLVFSTISELDRLRNQIRQMIDLSNALDSITNTTQDNCCSNDNHNDEHKQSHYDDKSNITSTGGNRTDVITTPINGFNINEFEDIIMYAALTTLILATCVSFGLLSLMVRKHVRYQARRRSTRPLSWHQSQTYSTAQTLEADLQQPQFELV